MQAFPNATKTNIYITMGNELLPGLSCEIEYALCEAVSPDVQAELLATTGKVNFTFTELSKLSKEQLSVWEVLSQQSGKAQNVNEYYDLTKARYVEVLKNVQSKAEPHVDFRYDGWDQGVAQLVYDGSAHSQFTSRQILGFHMKNYRRYMEDKAQKEKDALKKRLDNSNGF